MGRLFEVYNSNSDLEKLKSPFLIEITSIVTMDGIDPEMILNWDQSGMKILPSANGLLKNEEQSVLKWLEQRIKVKLLSFFVGH